MKYQVIARHGSHVLETVIVEERRLLAGVMVDLGWKYPCVQIDCVEVAPIAFDWMPETAPSGRGAA
jgi:hypothetical protein